MQCTVEEIFSRNLPSVNSNAAAVFASGMQAYYEVFKQKRDSDLNYDKASDYYDEWNQIMEVGQDDLWVHTPHFRKILGLAISKLFKTKITMFSPPCTVKPDHSMMFIDQHANRWGVSVMQSASDPQKVRVCARFPIPRTRVSKFQITTEEKTCNPSFNSAFDNTILVQDAEYWHKEEESPRMDD
jgi:hypothetical protein